MTPIPPAPSFDPDDQPPALPPMSYREASWHGHIAATRAEANPADPTAAARDLARASLPGVTIHGIHFDPATAGALLAIQGAARLASDAARPIEGAEEVAVLVFCMAQPEHAFALTESGNLEGLIKEARLLLAPVAIADLPSLVDYAKASLAEATGAPAQKKTGA